MIICIDDTRRHTNPNAENYHTPKDGLWRLVQLWTAQYAYGLDSFNIDELWLDFDMGFAGTNREIFQWLRCCGMIEDGLNVDTIYVHSGNPNVETYVEWLEQAHYIVKRLSIINVIAKGTLVEVET